MTKLTGRQIADEKLDGWILLVDGLQTRIRTNDFAAGLTIVNAIGAAAENLNHHPDLTLRWGSVDVRLTSHDAHGVTDRDLRLARAITAIAADAGTTTETTGVSRLELGLDTPASAAVQPFWVAVLAAAGSADEVRDDYDTLPAIWFQESGIEEPRQRWHPDVFVAPSEVQPRIDAAVAAGGTLVSDAEAPSFWVLADPEGNRVCLCTWQDRSA